METFEQMALRHYQETKALLGVKEEPEVPEVGDDWFLLPAGTEILRSDEVSSLGIVWNGTTCREKVGGDGLESYIYRRRVPSGYRKLKNGIDKYQKGDKFFCIDGDWKDTAPTLNGEILSTTHTVIRSLEPVIPEGYIKAEKGEIIQPDWLFYIGGEFKSNYSVGSPTSGEYHYKPIKKPMTLEEAKEIVKSGWDEKNTYQDKQFQENYMLSYGFTSTEKRDRFIEAISVLCK